MNATINTTRNERKELKREIFIIISDGYALMGISLIVEENLLIIEW